MVLDTKLKENKGISILDEIRVGDFVQLNVNGEFFNREDNKPERYAGYVTQINRRTNNGIIKLSPTHPDNKMHGYDSLYDKNYNGKDMKEVPIEVSEIQKYRIIN